MAKHNIGDYSIEAGENGLETEAFSIEKQRITEEFDPVGSATIHDTTNFESADNLSILTSGGGTADVDSGIRLLLNVPDTADAHALAERKSFASWNYPTWGKRRRLRMSFWLENHTEEFGFGTGRVNLNNRQHSHIGCRINNGTLYATVGSDDKASWTESEMRTGLSDANQYSVLVDFDGNTDDTGTATVTVSQYPIDGSTTPNWTETHTFDASSGDPIPNNKESAQAFGWTAFSAMIVTPNGTDTDVHVNRAEYTLYPDEL